MEGSGSQPWWSPTLVEPPDLSETHFVQGLKGDSNAAAESLATAAPSLELGDASLRRLQRLCHVWL